MVNPISLSSNVSSFSVENSGTVDKKENNEVISFHSNNADLVKNLMFEIKGWSKKPRGTTFFSTSIEAWGARWWLKVQGQPDEVVGLRLCHDGKKNHSISYQLLIKIRKVNAIAIRSTIFDATSNRDQGWGLTRLASMHGLKLTDAYDPQEDMITFGVRMTTLNNKGLLSILSDESWMTISSQRYQEYIKKISTILEKVLPLPLCSIITEYNGINYITPSNLEIESVQ